MPSATLSLAQVHVRSRRPRRPRAHCPAVLPCCTALLYRCCRCAWQCSASTTWMGWTWRSPPCSTCARSTPRWAVQYCCRTVRAADALPCCVAWALLCCQGVAKVLCICCRAARLLHLCRLLWVIQPLLTSCSPVCLPALPACPALLGVQVKEEVHRGQLSSFGIPADLAAQPMYTLSGACWACCGCCGGWLPRRKCCMPALPALPACLP